MIRHYIKFFSCIIISLLCLQVFAEETISISVNTNEKTAAGIGYSVGGKDSGGTGKSYAGTGPKNKRYLFGYRKNSIKGTNISCCALTLRKDSKVTLITKGTKCRCVVK